MTDTESPAGKHTREWVLDLIHRLYGARKSADRCLAADAGSTPRAARNWLDRKAVPHTDHVLELMAANPEFHAGVMEMVQRVRAAAKRPNDG